MEQTTAVQINQVIDHLAEKLSVPASQLFQVLVRQAHVNLVIRSIQVGVAVSIFAVLAVLCFKSWHTFIPANRAYQEDRTDKIHEPVAEFVKSVVLSICGVAAAFASLICLGNWTDALGFALNPQYFAIQTILSALK